MTRNSFGKTQILVPLDAMRELEREGVIGKLHNRIYLNVGVSQPAFQYAAHGPRDG